MAGKDYSLVATQAAEAVKDLPEHLQADAMKVIMEDMLSSSGGDGNSTHAGVAPKGKSKKASKGPEKRSGNKTPGESVQPLEQAIDSIDTTRHPEVFKFQAELDKSLYILKMMNDEFGIDGLSTTEVSKILTDRFRLIAPWSANWAHGDLKLVNKQSF